jgi:hypothetical protein
VGAEKDPHVVFVENFGEESLEKLWERWDSAEWKDQMSFSTSVRSGR